MISERLSSHQCTHFFSSLPVKYHKEPFSRCWFKARTNYSVSLRNRSTRLGFSQDTFSSCAKRQDTLFSNNKYSENSASQEGPASIGNELEKLLALLPSHIRRRIEEHPEFSHLVEIVLDLGRRPVARFPSGDFVLSEEIITSGDLQQAISLVRNNSQIGFFFYILNFGR